MLKYKKLLSYVVVCFVNLGLSEGNLWSASPSIIWADDINMERVVCPLVEVKIGGVDKVCPEPVQQIAVTLFRDIYANINKIGNTHDILNQTLYLLKVRLSTWNCGNADAVDALTGYGSKEYKNLRLSLQMALDLKPGDFSKWDFNLSMGDYDMQLNEDGENCVLWAALGPKKGTVTSDANGNILYKPTKPGWDSVSWFADRGGVLELETKSIYVNSPLNVDGSI